MLRPGHAGPVGQGEQGTSVVIARPGQEIIPSCAVRLPGNGRGPVAGGFRSIDSDEMNIIRRNIVDFHAGGYHTFGGDPAGNALAINEMQRMAKLPLLITHKPGHMFVTDLRD